MHFEKDLETFLSSVFSMNSPISLILVFFIAKGTFGPFIKFSRIFLDFKSSSIFSKAISASFF